MSDTTPASGKDELENRVGIAMGLVHRCATNQWLMEVIQPGDTQWHKHDMTSEVQAIMQLIAQSNQQAVQKALEGLLEQKHDMVECESDDNWKGWTAGIYPMQAVLVSTIESALTANQAQKQDVSDNSTSDCA